MSTLEVNKITPVSGGTSITLGDSGDTFTIPSGVTITNNGTQTGFGGNNTPNFFANKTNDQTISSGSATKVEFNTEEFDSDSAFASDRFTVPSGQAGKYFFYTTCHFTGSTDQSYHIVEFFKNGSVAARSVNRFSGTPSLSESLSLIFDLGVGDYMEVYVKQNSGSGQILRGEASERKTYFVGFKLV